jgi:hypothetical protein
MMEIPIRLKVVKAPPDPKTLGSTNNISAVATQMP